MDYSSPGSSAHGFLQARILECVAIPFSRRCSLLKDWTRVSCIVSRFFTIWTTCYLTFSECKVVSVVSDSATIWTTACQTPLSMGFSRQEYWSGCHFLLQGIFTNQDRTCLIFPALAGGFFTSSITWEAALQIGSSVPPFWIPCIYVNTWCLFLSDLLILCNRL